MARLDTARQERLEPKRMEFAKNAIKLLGYEIVKETSSELNFRFKDRLVKFFPYSGWHTGATIKDGRGLDKLLKQIK